MLQGLIRMTAWLFGAAAFVLGLLVAYAFFTGQWAAFLVYGVATAALSGVGFGLLTLAIRLEEREDARWSA